MPTNENSRTTNNWLRASIAELEAAGIATARLDCLVLLEDAVGKDRSWLLAHPENTLSDTLIRQLNAQIVRRAAHEPLAYIRGKSEFYGRTFVVSPDTLEPRPETETMIDMVKKLPLASTVRIADVGAGSGAIGLTLALELPKSQIDLLEISLPALKIAQRNQRELGIKNVDIYRSDLLERARPPYDVIVANLPYVPASHTINQAAMHEPGLAIFGGEDGLDLYRDFFKQITILQTVPRFIVTESLPFQHEALVKIGGEYGFRQTQENDFIQVFAASPALFPTLVS